MGAKIAGLAQVIENLDAFRSEIGTTAIRDGARAAARVYAQAEREAAPVLLHKDAHSTALDPGAIRDDIRVTAPTVDESGIVHVFVGPGKRTRRVAGWVEWGHRLVKRGYSEMLANGKTRGPGEEVGSVRPHPFLRPSYERSQQEAVQAFTKAAAGRLRRWMR